MPPYRARLPPQRDQLKITFPMFEGKSSPTCNAWTGKLQEETFSFEYSMAETLMIKIILWSQKHTKELLPTWKMFESQVSMQRCMGKQLLQRTTKEKCYYCKQTPLLILSASGTQALLSAAKLSSFIHAIHCLFWNSFFLDFEKELRGRTRYNSLQVFCLTSPVALFTQLK